MLLLREVSTSVLATGGQAIVTIAFLVHQAATLSDAIARTLWRLVISRRHMLEWETAAATERRLGNSLLDFLRFMIVSPSVAISAAILILVSHRESWFAATPILLLWLVAPALGYWISRPIHSVERPLSEDERRRFGGWHAKPGSSLNSL